MKSYCYLAMFFLLPSSSSVDASTNGWELYKSSLSEKPLLTKAVTSSVIMSVSDVLCQRLEQSMDRHHHDTVQNKNTAANNCDSIQATPLGWRRTLDVAITGFTFSGPISHTWYSVLEHLVTVEDKMVGLLLRMLLDAFIFSPVAVFGYFTYRTILEGGGLSDVFAKLHKSYVDALFASWKFWPGANIINFTFVSLEYRVLYNNILSLFWTGYLSHINSRNGKRTTIHEPKNIH